MGAARHPLGPLDCLRQLDLLGEGLHQLLVEVDPVGHADHRWIRETRIPAQLLRVEDHRVALAGALGMPDHTRPAVGFSPPCGCLDGAIDRVHLVVFGENLPPFAAVDLEQDEVLNEVKQPHWGESAAQHHLELGLFLALVRIHRLPLGEMLRRRGDRADARLDQIRNAHDLDEAVERWDRLHVVGNLGDRSLGRCLLAGRVLELDLSKRDAIDEEQQVRPAVLAANDHRELVEGEEVVALRMLEVDQLGAHRALDSLPVLISDRDPLYQ